VNEVVIYLGMVGLALVSLVTLAALRQAGLDSQAERARDGER
jgi:hypothetical protein